VSPLAEVLLHGGATLGACLARAARIHLFQSSTGASEEAIADGCRVAGADPSAFLDVLEARHSGRGLQLSLDDPLADRFNSAAERLAAFTDAFGR